MFDFLGVTEHFPAVENVGWNMRWSFMDSDNLPINIDGITFAGKVQVRDKVISMDVQKSPLPDDVNMLVISCEGLPQGRWPYEIWSKSDSGDENRLVSGCIGVTASIDKAKFLVGEYASRTCLVRLPGDKTKFLKLEWLASTVAAASAQEAILAADRAESAADGLESAKDEAQESATHAAESARLAKVSETNAGEAEKRAEESKTSAGISATQSGISATSAHGYANTASTKAMESAGSATMAANSATAASTSETQAVQSAARAEESALEAKTEVAKIGNSVAESEAAASLAQASANTASGHATTAGTKATQAATSATNAAASETKAKASETAAGTSASSADGSAMMASTKAAQAEQSATTAENSAKAASLSAEDVRRIAAEVVAMMKEIVPPRLNYNGNHFFFNQFTEPDQPDDMCVYPYAYLKKMVGGKDNYQLWLDAGNVGTLEDFLEAQKGAPGGEQDLSAITQKLESKTESVLISEDDYKNLAVKNPQTIYIIN